ncbi:HAD-IIB family hydrolase [Patescibacteria group bacterium]|nr:HAD-IIB family hydrolase [Patescibacteria group bacterium]MDE1946345.1 HAD-IIB family hydrolase [Patescibacteria group bacterium]MDE2010797.1 HAD-IIB family hydrolase [Patescibacteria group bacterium]MDE2233270.1 HAD-IIB family hydrolase [Patescibacteria group bacterium]
MPNYDLIIFDLDGTLAPSKSPLESDMGELLSNLLEKKKVAVISGGGFHQFETQFLVRLPTASDRLSNLLLLPTSGTKLYTWKGAWCEEYAEHLSPKEKEKILTALNESLMMAGIATPDKIYGQQIEDRGSQITFSALGQQAPLALKSAWDPGHAKRQKIVDIMKNKIPEFDVRIGGTTSIDITKRGVNKGYGIRKLEEYLKMPLDRMVFVGDALFQGGNDYPAKATGIDCIKVKDPRETKELIGGWLGKDSISATTIDRAAKSRD